MVDNDINHHQPSWCHTTVIYEYIWWYFTSSIDKGQTSMVDWWLGLYMACFCCRIQRYAGDTWWLMAWMRGWSSMTLVGVCAIRSICGLLYLFKHKYGYIYNNIYIIIYIFMYMNIYYIGYYFNLYTIYISTIVLVAIHQTIFAHDVTWWVWSHVAYLHGLVLWFDGRFTHIGAI